MKLEALDIMLGLWGAFTLWLFFRALRSWVRAKNVRQPYFRADRYWMATRRTAVALFSAYGVYEAVFWFYCA